MDEISEAVYVVSKITNFNQKFNFDNLLKHIDESIFKSMIRILVFADLISFDGSMYYFNAKNKEDIQRILEDVNLNRGKLVVCKELYQKIISKQKDFFDGLSEIEYEIYSRCNFEYSYSIGLELLNFINFTGCRIMDLGGNSGGLATAIAQKHPDSTIVVVDSKIPCEIGFEFKDINQINNIDFLEFDFFKLNLPSIDFDYIILSNILHDFDNKNCKKLIQICQKHSNVGTKLLLIEDILINEFEPQEALLHGLRLATNVKGGRQRTIAEISELLDEFGYNVDNSIPLNDVQRLLVAMKFENKVKHRV